MKIFQIIETEFDNNRWLKTNIIKSLIVSKQNKKIIEDSFIKNVQKLSNEKLSKEDVEDILEDGFCEFFNKEENITTVLIYTITDVDTNN